MSTEHINEELDAALAQVKAIMAKNEAERHRLLNEQTEADQALVEDVEAGAALVRAAQQRHEDESAERQHRLAQANRIAGVRSETPPAPVSNDTDVSATVFDQDREEPEAPAASTLPPPASPPPTEAVVVERRRNHIDPREWDSPLPWILAIIGALIGIVVASNTWEDVVDDLDGFVRSLIATLWWIGIVGIGFFGGGTLGSWLSSRFNRE